MCSSILRWSPCTLAWFVCRMEPRSVSSSFKSSWRLSRLIVFLSPSEWGLVTLACTVCNGAQRQVDARSSVNVIFIDYVSTWPKCLKMYWRDTNSSIPFVLELLSETISKDSHHPYWLWYAAYFAVWESYVIHLFITFFIILYTIKIWITLLFYFSYEAGNSILFLHYRIYLPLKHYTNLTLWKRHSN